MPLPESSLIATQPAIVRLDGVTKSFSGHVAVDAVTLELRRGEFFALLGPSGCGKTTLLRMLAGFEMPDAGRILLDGEDIAPVPPHRRPVNMMFQSYALFPHLSVERNVAFGLRQENLPREEIAERVSKMLGLLQIEALARRKPHQLSGGQRQRVALARALVKRPKVFLLDEPLAALDKKLRSETQFELKELQRRLRVTFIVVTHDQEEAMIMADRIAVMNRGRIVQSGSPADIYERPNSRWVAEFIGEANIFEGEIAQRDADGVASVRTSDAGLLRVAVGAHNGPVTIVLRTEKVAIAPDKPTAEAGNALPGVISEIGYLGDSTVYRVQLDGGKVMRARLANVARGMRSDLKQGDRVWLSFAPQSCVVLSREAGR